jgi:seryl-tRNA synthetase
MLKELIQYTLIGLLIIGGVYAYRQHVESNELRRENAALLEDMERISDLHEETLARSISLQERADSAEAKAANHMQQAADAKDAAAVAEAKLDDVVSTLPDSIQADVMAAVEEERQQHASVVFQLESTIFDLENALADQKEANTILREDNLRLVKANVALQDMNRRLEQVAYPGFLGRLTRDPLLKVASVAVVGAIALSAVN